MKFHQVAIGESFIYRAKTFTKVSPVLARNNDNGEQCFMRRADGVEIVTEVETTKKITGRSKAVDVVKLKTRFDNFINASIKAIQLSVDDLSTEQEKKIIAIIQQQGDVFRSALNQHKK